jgi:hypothetical protein
MLWFKHDTNATHDAKLRKLILAYGSNGYAVYFHCLELIASDVSDKNLTFELEHDSEIIADNLKMQGTPEKSAISLTEDIMRYIVELGLFENSNGRITCLKLLKRLDGSMSSNPRFRRLLTTAREQNHDIVMTNLDGVMTNLDGVMTESRIVMQEVEVEVDKKKNTNTNTVPQASRFTRPTLVQVADYCQERHNQVNPQTFIDHYESNGWKVGKNPMKDWKAAVRTWEKNSYDKPLPVHKRSAMLEMGD